MIEWLIDDWLIDWLIADWFINWLIDWQVLQLVLPEEVKPDSSTAKRSQITGHLLITMPKVRRFQFSRIITFFLYNVVPALG